MRTINNWRRSATIGNYQNSRYHSASRGSISLADNNLSWIIYSSSSNELTFEYVKSALNGKTINKIVVNGTAYDVTRRLEARRGGSQTLMTQVSVTINLSTIPNSITIDAEFADGSFLYSRGGGDTGSISSTCLLVLIQA